MGKDDWREIETDTRDRLSDRLSSKFVKTDSCWIWTGGKSLGYGMYSFQGKVTTAHRVVYEALVGLIPEGLQIDHLCRDRACVNPNHLEAVTQAENIRRGDAGRHESIKTHCRRGHAYNEENIYRTAWGGRQCRECSRISRAKYKEKVYGQR